MNVFKRNISSTKKPYRPKFVKKAPSREQYTDQNWIYGERAVWEALLNPRRKNRTLLHVQPFELHQISKIKANLANEGLEIRVCEKSELQRIFGPQAVHQGMGLLSDPLPEIALEDADQNPVYPCDNQRLWIALDGVTDPHNVGAVIRLAAAFGALGIVLPRHGSPALTPALYKVAAGGIEHVHVVYTNSLIQALENLKTIGYQVVGMDERAEHQLDQNSVVLQHHKVMVMGAEGEGLRKSTRKACDVLVTIPTQPRFPSLNVATAAAITLYQLSRNLASLPKFE